MDKILNRQASNKHIKRRVTVNKPFNKKVFYAIFSVLLIGMIAGSGLTVALTPTQTFAIYGGNYPGAPEFTVWESDGEYYAKNQYGVIVYSGTNATSIINSALNALTTGRTWQEKVLLMGDITIDSTILVPAYTILENTGRVTLADNSDCNMLELKAGLAAMIEIFGGLWDGNGDNQASGDGFNIQYIYETAGWEQALVLHDFSIIECRDDNLYVHRDSVGNAFLIIDNIELIQPKGGDSNSWGLHLEQINDAVISNIRPVDRVRLQNVWMSHFSNLYINTVLNMSGCVINSFDNIVLDTNLWNWYMYQCNSSNYNNFLINKISSGVISEAACNVVSSYNNNFNNVQIGHHSDTGSSTWRMGFFETTGYNNFYNNIRVDSSVTEYTLKLHIGAVNSSYSLVSSAALGAVSYYS